MEWGYLEEYVKERVLRGEMQRRSDQDREPRYSSMGNYLLGEAQNWPTITLGQGEAVADGESVAEFLAACDALA